MKKRRITLNLDDDVAEALEAVGGRSMSATANAVLRDGLARQAHRVALLGWLDQLDAEFGAPSVEDLAAADHLLDVAQRNASDRNSAA